jgi:DNA-binding response OmpR family regulator
LIIDDDEDINNLFKIYLENRGYQIDAYTDPVNALYYFKKRFYDLVLLDLKNAADRWHHDVSTIKENR